MNSISYIKQIINQAGGVQRINRFNVTVDTPNGINTIPAYKVTFGGRQIDTITDFMSGPGNGRNIPINQNYGPGKEANLLITFPIEQDWNTYKKMENWMNTLVNDGSLPQYYGPSFARPYNSYARPGLVVVECLNMNGATKATFTFSEAYPVKIYPIEMNAEITDKFLTFDIGFLFRNYGVS